MGADKAAKEGIAKLREMSKPLMVGKLMLSQVALLVEKDDGGKARLVAKEAVQLFRDNGEKALEAQGLLSIAELAMSAGKLNEAETSSTMAITMYRGANDIMGEAHAKE